MMTVNEVSKLTGVSIRTLQYYDTIGLLKPIEYTESGYRLYDDTSLERLQQILLFKELEFPLSRNKKICVFESDILHILLADSILSTTKRFRKMKKLQFLKVGDYMKTITRATKHPPI